MTDYLLAFSEQVQHLISKVMTTQRPKLEAVSEKMADCFVTGGNMFVFGPGHAGIVAEEFVYRPGGLAVMNPLFHPELALTALPVTRVTACENTPGVAAQMLAESSIRAGDFLLIHSVAGRSAVVVEMARIAQERGITVAAIVNEDFARFVTSGDPSGKRLTEVVAPELTVDNGGCVGDASLELDGMSQRVGATSSILGTFLVQALVIETCRKLLERGITPPVFQASNAPGGAAFNEALLNQWKDRIFYL